MAKRLDIPEETILYVKDLLANKKEFKLSFREISILSGISAAIVKAIHYKRYRYNNGVKRDKLNDYQVELVKQILRDRDFGKIEVSIQDVSNMTGIPYGTVYNIDCGLDYANIGGI